MSDRVLEAKAERAGMTIPEFTLMKHDTEWQKQNPNFNLQFRCPKCKGAKNVGPGGLSWTRWLYKSVCNRCDGVGEVPYQ